MTERDTFLAPFLLGMAFVVFILWFSTVQTKCEPEISITKGIKGDPNATEPVMSIKVNDQNDTKPRYIYIFEPRQEGNMTVFEVTTIAEGIE